mmetsp:Transcript_87176/g.159267  ORF Transcript_87176/g.159267 Transcript_87176/m.159267 type:complete len:255 (+) Transcript_87176:986-1750(+)
MSSRRFSDAESRLFVVSLSLAVTTPELEPALLFFASPSEVSEVDGFSDTLGFESATLPVFLSFAAAPSEDALPELLCSPRTDSSSSLRRDSWAGFKLLLVPVLPAATPAEDEAPLSRFPLTSEASDPSPVDTGGLLDPRSSEFAVTTPEDETPELLSSSGVTCFAVSLSLAAASGEDEPPELPSLFLIEVSERSPGVSSGAFECGTWPVSLSPPAKSPDDESPKLLSSPGGVTCVPVSLSLSATPEEEAPPELF